MDAPYPVAANLPDNDNLVIEWSDGARLCYPLDLLRARCPCAHCVAEATGEVQVQREMFPGITLKTLDQVGNYAFQIGFSDQHSLGIYTYRMLHEMGEPLEEQGDPFSV